MIAGSIVISTYGEKIGLINSVFRFMLLSGFCIFVAGLRPSVSLLAFATFFFSFSLPIISGSIHTIFQRKVVPNLQGRVFALMRSATGISLSLAYIVVGPLADNLFEPLLTPDGLLATSLGQIIGIGSGRGIALMFITMGIITILLTFAAYQYTPLRLLEYQIPDIQQESI
ncbi:major facilitator superfamily MFS_1 [Nostoc sp. NIES-4103]|nr:major facilitator superfamily MFS_1 [Nostoc sp. NIES-4103]